MNIYIFIKQAFLSIKANKLRAFLSTLWIIIWISSFVIMLAMWEWAKASIAEGFDGKNNVITVLQNSRPKSSAKDVLTEDISELIKTKLPWIKDTFITSDVLVDLEYNGKKLRDWIVVPVQQGYLEFKKIELLYWNSFTKDDFKENKRVIIIWNKLVKSTFKDVNPIWKKMTLWWVEFTVKGILSKKNWSVDVSIYSPYSTVKNTLWIKSIRDIIVVIDDEKKIDSINKYLDYFLYKKSFIDKYKDVKFRTRTNKESMEQLGAIVQSMSLLLLWIWAIALIVWWIGIMNIMLVSVTERTREIWIRKAIWATNLNILSQFLIESILLTLIWAIVALWFSEWAVYLISVLIKDFNPIINTNVVVTATSVATGMWIVFGLMPAYKAAKLKIIDALSFE